MQPTSTAGRILGNRDATFRFKRRALHTECANEMDPAFFPRELTRGTMGGVARATHTHHHALAKAYLGGRRAGSSQNQASMAGDGPG